MFVEKRFLKLVIIWLLVSTIPTKLDARNFVTDILQNNTKLVFSSGVVCDRYDIVTFIGANDGKFEKLTNSSETFCGFKSVLGFTKDNLFCGCVNKVGFKADLYDSNNANNEDIADWNSHNGNNNFFYGKRFITYASLAWNIWNIYNNLNIIINYIKNALPDFENIKWI